MGIFLLINLTIKERFGWRRSSIQSNVYFPVITKMGKPRTSLPAAGKEPVVWQRLERVKEAREAWRAGWEVGARRTRSARGRRKASRDADV